MSLRDAIREMRGIDPEDDQLEPCPECKKEVYRSEKDWTHDRYGNPWKRVCGDCYDSVRESISRYRFDEGYAGEHLDEDY